MLPPQFETFAQQRPVAVMARALVERLFQAERLDQLARQYAESQRQRTLLFSTLYELMHAVVLGAEPSVYAACRKRRQQLPVSFQAVYDKLANVEEQLCEALVRDSAEQAEAMIDLMDARHPALLPGRRVRILDGNHFSATQHRLKELRSLWDAPLPGQMLVVLEPETGLAVEVIASPNGHAQERSLLSRVAEHVEAGDVWIADRMLATQSFMAAIIQNHAEFVLRQHGQMKGTLQGERRWIGRSETGDVYEQAIEFRYDEETYKLRRITVELTEPTRDGETELHILSNLPEAIANAVRVSELYRSRWSIETFFYEVTQTLECEIDSLCYPKAALLVFSVALMSANATAVLKGSLRCCHGADAASELSDYYLSLELEQTVGGMMVALPPSEWCCFRVMELDEFVSMLNSVASFMELFRYRKTVRGPKKPPPKKNGYKNGSHVSTYKLIKERKP